MGRGVLAGSHQAQKRLDLREVVTLPGQQVVGVADTAAHVEYRRTVLPREAGIEGLRHHGIHANGPQERGLPRHVRAFDQHAASTRYLNRVRNRLPHQRVVDALEPRRHRLKFEVRSSPVRSAGPVRGQAHGRINVTSRRDDPKQRLSVRVEVLQAEVDTGGVEEKGQVQGAQGQSGARTIAMNAAAVRQGKTRYQPRRASASPSSIHQRL